MFYMSKWENIHICFNKPLHKGFVVNRIVDKENLDFLAKLIYADACRTERARKTSVVEKTL